MKEFYSIADEWPKKITVDKRIVGILSSSTYKNFPRALKELITNSFDADALRVDVDIDVQSETIIISDNGKGMGSDEFSLYLRIAGKSRSKNENHTELGRTIIGQFGVGFLSVFPFFKNYSIATKKAGSSETLYATIPLYKYFDSSSGALDVDSININGGIKKDENLRGKSFTKITLTGFNELTRSFFKENIKKKNIEVESYPGIERIKWMLSEDLPIEFSNERFNKIFNYPEFPRFSVFVNQIELYRGVYGDEILETHKGDYQEIGKIKFKYFIATPRRAVTPHNGQFMKIRNLNVGLGDKREDFSERRSGGRSRLHWLTGEVHIIDGMNDLIKVSRDDFNFSQDYEDLKDFFNRRLQYFSSKLETESELKKEIIQTGTEFRVKNISLLNPENLKKKIENFEKEGYEIVNHSNSIRNDFTINNETKEISIKSNLADFEKFIIINNERYSVKSDDWDFRFDLYPACKIFGRTIVVNSKYPLFKGIKYTDVFVKIHILLLINLNTGVIDQNAYNRLSKDILIYYSDY